jgi:hypothetical protein
LPTTVHGPPLTICGIVQDERYFAERVAPHVDGDRVVFLARSDRGAGPSRPWSSSTADPVRRSTRHTRWPVDAHTA